MCACLQLKDMLRIMNRLPFGGIKFADVSAAMIWKKEDDMVMSPDAHRLHVFRKTGDNSGTGKANKDTRLCSVSSGRLLGVVTLHLKDIIDNFDIERSRNKVTSNAFDGLERLKAIRPSPST